MGKMIDMKKIEATETLIHEMAHAKSGIGDSCTGFEMALTEILGLIASKSL